jgi:hypothetical protein
MPLRMKAFLHATPDTEAKERQPMIPRKQCAVLQWLAAGLVAFFLVSAQAQDRDLDNDGAWDYDRGGSDRDIDNDGSWDYDKGGVDRDLDNDALWDESADGIDRDLDNDGVWDE